MMKNHRLTNLKQMKKQKLKVKILRETMSFQETLWEESEKYKNIQIVKDK